MNKFHSLILSALCVTTFASQASTHEEQLQYEVLQRKTTQKMILNMRNISGIITFFGACTMMYASKMKYQHEDRLIQQLAKGTISLEPFELNLPSFYTTMLLRVGNRSFIPSLITFITTTCYGFYNDMHIKSLQQELNRLTQPT